MWKSHDTHLLQRVSDGFQRDFRRVSGGVSGGFPRVSGGFQMVCRRNWSCEVMVFLRPGIIGPGFPAACAYPYYNIKKVNEPSAVVVGAGAVVIAPELMF